MEEIVKFLVKGAVDKVSLLSLFPCVPFSVLIIPTISCTYQFLCYKHFCILLDKHKPLF